MAMRQYIGARYTTKVYENSLDPSSAEWEAGVTYEPLTLVTYLNSSYLSKKDVPGSVGDPSANPSYWVLTGAYNGQILNLQNQINAINQVIGSLAERQWIFVGDSFGASPAIGDDWCSFMVDMMTTKGITSYRTHLSGAAFYNDGYLTALQSLTVADPDKITDILVGGGINDMNNLAGLATGMSTFVAYMKTTYPNATLHYAPFALTTTASGLQYVVDFIAYANGAANGIDKCDIVPDSYLVFRKYGNLGGDGVHPTINGSHEIANNLIGFCLTGSLSLQNGYDFGTFDWYDPSVIDTVNSSASISTLEVYSPTELYIQISPFTVAFLAPTGIWAAATRIATITAPKYLKGNLNPVLIPIHGLAYVSGTPQAWTGSLVVYDSEVSIIGDGLVYADKIEVTQTASTLPIAVC